MKSNYEEILHFTYYAILDDSLKRPFHYRYISKRLNEDNYINKLVWHRIEDVWFKVCQLRVRVLTYPVWHPLRQESRIPLRKIAPQLFSFRTYIESCINSNHFYQNYNERVGRGEENVYGCLSSKRVRNFSSPCNLSRIVLHDIVVEYSCNFAEQLTKVFWVFLELCGLTEPLRENIHR